MHPAQSAALDWFMARQNEVIASGSDGATLINVKPSTMRTRLRQGYALAKKQPAGDVRSHVEFTGAHLVYNMLHDSFAKWHLNFDDDGKTLKAGVRRVQEEVLSGPKSNTLWVRAVRRDDGEAVHWFENGKDLEERTGESVIAVPIATMVIRLAWRLYAQHEPDAMREMLHQNA